MPNYIFELRDGSAKRRDPTGVYMPGPEAALEYGEGVARELMRGCEAETRTWRLDVYDEGQDEEPIFEIPFVQLDQTLDYLTPELRRTLVEGGERRRALKEALQEAKSTVTEARALVARSRGRPYLASYRGKTTIARR